MRPLLGITFLLPIAAGAACELAVDTGGLTGGADAGRVDASVEAAADGPTVDAPADAAGDGTQDAGPPCTSPMIMFVQAGNANTLATMSNSIALVMPGPQKTGDSLVVGLNYEPACGSVQGISDTSGNAYQSLIAADGDPRGGAGLLETWGAAGVAAADGGANTVTVTFGAICTSKNIKVVEYQGVDPTNLVDDTAFMHGDGGAPTATLTARPFDMLFAHTADSSRAVEAGTGWTQLLIDNWGTLAEDELAPSGGMYAATYQPIAGEQWGIQAVALRCK